MHTSFQTPVGRANPRWAKTALLAPLIGLLGFQEQPAENVR